ncbi:MAG: type II secretion system protein GspM [Acidobacteriia bacterium]|nr:type II secretion system protein GspM [Terriglobia bacterium]
MKFNIPKLGSFSRFSAREKKVIGLGLSAALLFVILDFVVFPTYDRVKQCSDAISERVKTVEKYKEKIAERQDREQSLGATEKQLAELESHLLRSRSASAAQAELQGAVNDLAKQSQLQVSRTDFLPTKELSRDYQKVSVRLDALGTINQITAFLTAAKNMPQFVFNDELRLAVYNATSEDYKKTKQISTTLVVSGVLRHE